jgi:hypothetical protein
MAPPGFEFDSTSSEEERTGGRGRVVRMVSHGDEDAAGARAGARGSTLLATVLATGPAPKFSVEEADWETFSYDWKMYVEIRADS